MKAEIKEIVNTEGHKRYQIWTNGYLTVCVKGKPYATKICNMYKAMNIKEE